MSIPDSRPIYRKDLRLEELLRGKRIAFVGPSPHLVGTGSGSLIESYDIVARVNLTEPIPDHLQKDYGRRMDIMVACCNRDNLRLLKEQYARDVDFLRNVKYVLCTQSTTDKDGNRVDLGFQQINKYNTPFHIIGDDYAEYIDQIVGCETNTGFNAILTFLNYPIRELYITGFSFYNMGHGGKVWYDEAFDNRVRIGMLRANPQRVLETPSHSQKPQMDYFVRLLKTHRRLLTVDSYLRDNLPIEDRSANTPPNAPVTPEQPPQAIAPRAWKLEIAVTDYCNLSCSLCSQGTPLQQQKKTMSRADIQRIARNVADHQFDVVKISGGEPTLHPDFGWLCKNLRQLFRARRYELATNGFRLTEYKDLLGAFDAVDLAHYPGANDQTVADFRRLALANVNTPLKRPGAEMMDVYRESNLDKKDIYSHCKYAGYRKVVQDLIFPCCVIFGQSIRQNIPVEDVSVRLDANWRDNLEKIDIEPHCRRCFVDVDAPLRTLDPVPVPRTAALQSPGSISPAAERITIFAMPKAFQGHNDIIQQNAIKSWLLLEPTPEIILLGDDAGVADAAGRFNVRHIPHVRCNEKGTPLISDIFALAAAHATSRILTYINSDMILLGDFMPALRQVRERFDEFLMIGQRWDSDITKPLDFDDADWEKNLRWFVHNDSYLHWTTGIDYFAFTPGFWSRIPDFAIGRTAWDSWLVGNPIDCGKVVVDATEVVMAIHQDHAFIPKPGRDDEENVNRKLAGAQISLGRTSCAPWKITPAGVVLRPAGEFLKDPDPAMAFKCVDLAARHAPGVIRRQCDHFLASVALGKLKSLMVDAKNHLLATPGSFTARRILEFAGEEDTNVVVDLFNRGLDALRAQNPALALQYLNKVLRYSVELPNLHYAVAIALTQLNDPDAARQACRKELAVRPQNEPARQLLERLTGATSHAIGRS